MTSTPSAIRVSIAICAPVSFFTVFHSGGGCGCSSRARRDEADMIVVAIPPVVLGVPESILPTTGGKMGASGGLGREGPLVDFIEEAHLLGERAFQLHRDDGRLRGVPCRPALPSPDAVKVLAILRAA